MSSLPGGSKHKLLYPHLPSTCSTSSLVTQESGASQAALHVCLTVGRLCPGPGISPGVRLLWVEPRFSQPLGCGDVMQTSQAPAFLLGEPEVLTHTWETPNGLAYMYIHSHRHALCVLPTHPRPHHLRAPPPQSSFLTRWGLQKELGDSCPPHQQPLSGTFGSDHAGVCIPRRVPSFCPPRGSPASLFPPLTSSHFFCGCKNPESQQHPLGSFLRPDFGALGCEQPRYEVWQPGSEPFPSSPTLSTESRLAEVRYCETLGSSVR